MEFEGTSRTTKRYSLAVTRRKGWRRGSEKAMPSAVGFEKASGFHTDVRKQLYDGQPLDTEAKRGCLTCQEKNAHSLASI